MAHLPLDIKSPAGLRILAETRLSVAGSVTYILLGTNQSVNTLSQEFSLFDSKFLEEISKMKEKNLAVELLKRLIAEQVQIYRHMVAEDTVPYGK